MNIYLCIPTLVRYDLLTIALESAEAGDVKPTKYFIVDNGGKLGGINHLDIVYIPEVCRHKTTVFVADKNLGVAKSWNHFLSITEKEEDGFVIIANDDVKFFNDTIKTLIESYDENFISYPGGAPSSNSFSCFLIPKNIVNIVGKFDESISPGYAYFEDNDYHYRMLQHGFDLKSVENCRLGHMGSGTLRMVSDDQIQEHHKRFRIAELNYLRKWGGPPGKEKFTIPYNNTQ